MNLKKETRYKQSGELKSRIENSRKILITTHVNPDGDAIGSTLALARVLKELKKDVTVITPNDFPSFLHWMPGAIDILVYFRNKKTAERIITDADLILCVDYSDSGRLEKAEKSVLESEAYKIMIDHHPEPADFTDLVISDTSVGSSAELVYYLLQDMNYYHLVDRQVAENIYVGIMTDTGNFSFASSYPEVWYTVAELLKLGINKDEIYSKIYDNFSQKRMRLMGYSLYENMEVLEDYHSALIYLSKENLNRFDHSPGDTEGFVNLPFSIKGIRLSALLMEKDDHIRISLRSRGDFSVNELARKHLDGGGHINAAGGELKMNLRNAVAELKEILKKYKNEI